jgi:hypothetical protein
MTHCVEFPERQPMLQFTQPEFEGLLAPDAHVSIVKDVGAVRVDLAWEQPPYVGLVLRLEHRDLPGEFDQCFKISDDALVELVVLLTTHASAAGLLGDDHEGDTTP